MIETERLLLRRPTEADVESPPAWLSDPEVMDWLGGVEPAAAVVRQWLDQWERFPTGKFLVELKSDGALVGRVGFIYPEGWPDFELGWLLGREHWGHGYAIEAARRALAWGRDTLKKDRVISLIRPGNDRSVKVALALGSTLTGETELLGGKVMVYEWRAP